MNHPRRTDRPSVTERLLEHGWSVLIFDGDCVLCSASVRFVAARSRRGLLAFSAMQSEPARRALGALGDAGEIDRSMLVLSTQGPLRRSDAVLHLLARMDAPWACLARVLRWVPRGLRDGIYNFVARNRYRLFGRRKHCMLAPPEMIRRFVR